jgi:hypothetical protein
LADIEVLDPDEQENPGAPEKSKTNGRSAAIGKSRGELVTLPARRLKAIPLGTLKQLRCELQRVYTDVRRGAIESQYGARLTYILGVVGRVLESEVIEQRLDRLEKARGESER